MDSLDLTAYLNQSAQNLVREALHATWRAPRQAVFLLRFLSQCKKACTRRLFWEKQGAHVPAFLISSITHDCNLHCKGCYACHNHPATTARALLSADEWGHIFSEAAGLGVSFHLLAGGEPLLRQDVLLRAAQTSGTLFPVFTNGTLLNADALALFDKHRNLLPVLSMEGGEQATDARRSPGVYRQLVEKMRALRAHSILFGVSLTVTRQNLSELASANFVHQLARLGCRIVFFIEYVPVDGAVHLAPRDKDRALLAARLAELRAQAHGMLFLSFPGDESRMGGCLAGGRGFFHISPYGDAEACPFSPYSDCNLRTHTLLEALRSPFFERLRTAGLTGAPHTGGCALFDREAEVQSLLSRPGANLAQSHLSN